MKLYLISQEIVTGYDTYDSAVVSAKDENDAKNIHPSDFVTHVTDGRWMGTYAPTAKTKAGQEYVNDRGDDWPRYSDIDHVAVEYLGETKKERGVICASFNAG